MVMKKIVISLSILLILFDQSYSSKTQKSFLWKASSQKGTVYLLGSIHVAKKEIYPLNSTIEEAFQQSNFLVVEVDIDSVSPFQQLNMLKVARYPNDDRIDNHISKKTFEMMKKYLTRHSINIEQLSQYKPWLVAMSIVMLELKSLGFNPENGIDRYFLTKAKEKKMKILELETFEEQIDFFNQFDDNLQDLFLFYTLVDLKNFEENINQLFKLWLNGDMKSFEQLFKKILNEHSNLKPIYDKLNDERNVKMIEKIKTYLDDDKIYFVVVGAGHLVGEKGIINLLRKKGYQVEQL